MKNLPPGTGQAPSGPFDAYYRNTSSRLLAYKVLFYILVGVNCTLGLHFALLRPISQDLLLLHIGYLFTLSLASIGVYSLSPKWLLPAIWFAIPNVVIPLCYFVYLTGVYHYCIVFQSWYIEGYNSLPTNDVCLSEFPYTFSHWKDSWIFLCYGLIKLSELVILLRLSRFIQADRDFIESERVLGPNGKGMNLPPDDTDDELVVFERLGHPPSYTKTGAPCGIRDVTVPSIV